MAQTPAEVVAGKLELIEGEVQFFDRSRRPRSPKLDEAIFEGEAIATGAHGEVHLRMEDGGLIAVRPGTKMRIVNFRAEGDANDRLVVGLLEGSFRSVTGWIAKFTRNNYIVRTSTATIGVRGTDHEPFHIPEGSRLGEPGTYDKVNQGATYIQTKQGRLDVSPGRAGFAQLRGVARPRLLDRVPAHFRVTKNEERVTRRYKEVQQRLQQQRDDRRRQIEQHRKKPGAQRDERRKQMEEQRKKQDAAKAERHQKQEAVREHRGGKAEPHDAAKKQRESAEQRRLEQARKQREAAEQQREKAKQQRERAAKKGPEHREADKDRN